MEQIKKAAESYRQGRHAHNERGKPWDKESACQEMFKAMEQDGVTPCNAMAGTFFGRKDGQAVVIAIDDGYETCIVEGDPDEVFDMLLTNRKKL